MAKKQLTTFTLGQQAQRSAISYMNDCAKRFDFATRRQRMTKIDKAIQLESDSRRNLRSKKDQRLDYFDDIEIGLISQQIDTVQGFLVDLYLTQQPIFAPVTSRKENTTFAQQVNAINFAHSQHFKWASELAIAFRDLAKYNICAVEVDWFTDTATKISNPSASETSVTGGESVLEEVAVSGNKITRLDIYNCFYDTSVRPSKVHSDGEFFGYAERITSVNLISRIRSAQAAGKIVMNIRHILDKCKATGTDTIFEYPCITPNTPKQDSRGYSALFAGVNGYEPKDSKYKGIHPSELYEIVTVYARIVPSMLGIPTSEGYNDLGIYKLTRVGDTVMMCERVVNAHNYFNTLLCQVREDGIGEQTKSIAEQIIPLQNLATKLFDYRVASAAKSLGNRIAYLAGAVDEKDVRSNDPSRPIRVQPNPLTKDIRAAITEIPFTDNSQQIIYQDIAQIRQMAGEINRLNRPQQGQFQKGNKTLGEFREVMNNANAELRVMGLLVENSLMIPVKTIIKSNIQQYQSVESLQTANGETVQIDPATLRSAMIEFKLADGLTVKEDIVDTASMKEMFMTAVQDPEFRSRYDIVGMFTYLMEVNGAKVKQFEIQAPAAQAGAAQPAQPPQA